MVKKKYCPETEEHNFGEGFVKRYLSHGFGAMTKTEVDLLVFYLLLQQKKYKKLNNYELARELKITEARVKSLSLNSSLRYAEVNHKAAVSEFVQSLLTKDKLADFEDDHVEIGVESPIQKQEIEYAIKKTGRTPEYGRNREILIFSSETLLALIMDNVEKGNKEFVQLVKDNIKNKRNHTKILDQSLTASERASKFISELSDKASLLSLLTTGGKIVFGLP